MVPASQHWHQPSTETNDRIMQWGPTQARHKQECEEAEAILAGQRGALVASQQVQGELIEVRTAAVAARAACGRSGGEDLH